MSSVKLYDVFLRGREIVDHNLHADQSLLCGNCFFNSKQMIGVDMLGYSWERHQRIMRVEIYVNGNIEKKQTFPANFISSSTHLCNNRFIFNPSLFITMMAWWLWSVPSPGKQTGKEWVMSIHLHRASLLFLFQLFIVSDCWVPMCYENICNSRQMRGKRSGRQWGEQTTRKTAWLSRGTRLPLYVCTERGDLWLLVPQQPCPAWVARSLAALRAQGISFHMVAHSPLHLNLCANSPGHCRPLCESLVMFFDWVHDSSIK
jgi:hypothetical protein